MSTPEANFWKTIKKNLPPKAFATRIENRHGGGIPDVHIIWDNVPFWLELKIILEKLRTACIDVDQQAIRRILLDAPTGFAPSDGIYDYVYHQKPPVKASIKLVKNF